MKRDEIDSLEEYKDIAVSMFILVVGFYILFNILPDFKIEANENWGPIGDFIGGILNPTFSLIALFALLATIRLQIKELNATNEQLKNSGEELNLTREEVTLARKATEDSAKALIKQNESIKIQNFENTFFNMLNLHNEIVKNISFDKSKDFVFSQQGLLKTSFIRTTSHPKIEYIEGREAIEKIVSSIDNIRTQKKEIIFNSVYNSCHDASQTYIGHYFGNIYQILKFISSTKNITDKKKYANLFRAQFSSSELKLLFYHCTGSKGIKKFKKYIEEFSFFEHLVLEEENENFKYILCNNFYHEKAFGDNKDRIKKFISKILSENEDYLNNITPVHQGCSPSFVFHIFNKYYQTKNFKKVLNILKEFPQYDNNDLIKKEIEETIYNLSKYCQEPQ